MITILVTNQNAMVVTRFTTIMQHTKNTITVRIFVPEKYYEHDMKNFSATLEVVPPNQKYQVLSLVPVDETVAVKEGYIIYDVDLDANFTMFSGDIQMQMRFVYMDTDQAKVYIRNTQSCKLPVTAIEGWSDLIADSALDALSQKLTKLDADAQLMNTLLNAYNGTKADNHTFDENGDLVLTANGIPIGDPVSVTTPGDDDIDGVNDGIIDADIVYNNVTI